MSRWLVVGCDGMLGQDLVAALGESPSAEDVTAVDRDVVDIIDPDACTDCGLCADECPFDAIEQG